MFFFFFSSRRRHTRLVSDWSSDVCSSDLEAPRQVQLAAKIDREQHAVRIERHRHQAAPLGLVQRGDVTLGRVGNVDHRSEERRVGKEWRARWSLDKSKEKVERSTSEQSVW